jgi:hypothetical protein
VSDKTRDHCDEESGENTVRTTVCIDRATFEKIEGMRKPIERSFSWMVRKALRQFAGIKDDPREKE